MNKRLLIVDDEKNIRLTLTRTLEPEGWDILTAINGEDAVAVLTSEKDIEVVLLDMKLPGMDGIEVLREISKSLVKPVVIMMTAYGTVASAVEAMKLGAVDYISKPFSPTQVRELLKTIEGRQELKYVDAVDYESSIGLAKQCINARDFDAAEEMLQKAIAYDSKKAEALNLMGVLLEVTGKVREAQKQYRAALVFEPTYEPASENLHRTTQFIYTREGINMGDLDKGDRGKGDA